VLKIGSTEEAKEAEAQREVVNWGRAWGSILATMATTRFEGRVLA
jgi:hypothetical protein